MKQVSQFSEFCTKVKTLGVEVASLVAFLVALIALLRHEILHLLR